MHWINVLSNDPINDITHYHHSTPATNANNITIKLLQVSNLQIKIAQNHKLYQIENNPKYFTEHPDHPHLDKKYGINGMTTEEIHKTLHYLFIEFKDNFLQSVNLSHVSKNVSYWLEYGTLLGAYRNKSIIPWDTDGDMGIFDFVLYELPLEYESMDWIFRRNPSQNSYIYDSHNTVSARFISKRNGVFIDFFSYSTVNEIEHNKTYVYNSWSLNNFDYWQLLDDLLPLNRSGIFLNDTFNVPRNTKQWLLNEYDTLEVPIEQTYDLDGDNYIYNFYTHDFEYPF